MIGSPHDRPCTVLLCPIPLRLLGLASLSREKARLQLDEVPLEEAFHLLQLPKPLHATEHFSRLIDWANKRIMLSFGDLDAVWADSATRSRFLHLPQAILMVRSCPLSCNITEWPPAVPSCVCLLPMPYSLVNPAGANPDIELWNWIL